MSDEARSAEIESLVQHWAGVIRSAAARFGLSQADEDEVTQDVRIRVWRAMQRPGPVNRALTPGYGYQAAVSAAIDLVRRRRSERPERSVPLEDVGDLLVSVSPGSGPAKESDLVALLDQALTEVSESRRPAVRLHLRGRHLSEIARVMGCSEAAARNLLYRGLAELRLVLEREGAQR